MPGPFGHNIREYLTALADGELEGEQKAEVLRYVASHPEAAEQMEMEQRLRMAARRAVREGTPAASAQLKARIRDLAESSPASERHGEPHTGSRFEWRLAAVAAVALVIGALAARLFAPSAALPPAPTHPSAATDAPLPPALVAAATRGHVECARLAAHAGPFPPTMATLAAAVQSDMGTTGSAPDLSAAGYGFVGAGPCPSAREGTVHLLYRSTRPDVVDAVSVYLQPNAGQFPIEAGRVYVLSDRESAHPMCLWRTQGAVYLVVGDDAATVRRVVALLGMTVDF